ncbi:MAG: hypothetical protein ACMXX9_00120 [Candidatus Woesearchaeota archaeon]
MSNFKKKGQSSIEFLMIVAVATALLLPTSYFFFSYAQGSTTQIASAQINTAGIAIKQAAEEMYGVGPNSWKTIEIRLPDIIIETGIRNNNELYFTYNTQNGISQNVYFFDRFNISNHEDCSTECLLDIGSGINRIRVQSTGSSVLLISP